MEPINLDGMDPSELWSLANTLNTLQGYCVTKAIAMDCRATGKLGEAIRLEGRCEAIYASLPPEAKW